MATEDNLDDDYVARLLSEDAKKTSQRYLTQGLSAFLPTRRAIDAPKPNTRFLSHIVREADSHNAALKRREESEARRRLQDLRGEEWRPRKRARVDETADSKRSRILKDVVSAVQSESTVKRQRRIRSSQDDQAQRPRHNASPGRSRSHRSNDRRRESRSPRRRRHRSLSSDRELKGTKRRTSRSLSPKVTKKASRSSDDVKKRSSDVPSRPYGYLNSNSDNKPPKRGRGADKTYSGIDSRFSKDYDPSQDITPDMDPDSGDAEDWDMALEAMRDRAKWRQNQASRMKEAGFEERDIIKWEESSLHDDRKEPDIRDVKWSCRGEMREWDAGKVSQ